MAIVSFVPLLVTTVQQYFTAQGITAKVDFGRKARDKVVNQGPGGANRVVFMPGDPGGSAGKISGARQNVGQNPRPILTWEKLLTVSVWAVDTSDPANELLQFAAVEALFEATVAAIRSCAHADGRIGDPKWTTPPIENAFGYELTFPVVVAGPLFGAVKQTRTPSPAIVPAIEMTGED